jgi:hypothetical protein
MQTLSCFGVLKEYETAKDPSEIAEESIEIEAQGPADMDTTVAGSVVVASRADAEMKIEESTNKPSWHESDA